MCQHFLNVRDLVYFSVRYNVEYAAFVVKYQPFVFIQSPVQSGLDRDTSILTMTTIS